MRILAGILITILIDNMTFLLTNHNIAPILPMALHDNTEQLRNLILTNQNTAYIQSMILHDDNIDQ